MTSMRLDPTIVDLTGVTPKALRIKDRPSASIDAVVLHQMGLDRGETPTNYTNTKAHFGVTRGGTIIQFHPVSAYLNASSALNAESVAVEFVGNFRSDRGQWWSGNKSRSVITTAQINAGRDLLMWLRDNHGIWNVFAHAQGESASDRGNCPGPEIWYHIGEWAISELGFSDGGKGFKAGKGSPIPDRWRKQIF